MKNLIKLATKASSALADTALAVAVSSVKSCCHCWFAQPVEPEELRELVDDK